MMTRWLLLVLLCCVVGGTRHVDHVMHEEGNTHEFSNCRWKHETYPVKAYWLNLDQNHDRSVYMESQLTRIGMAHTRVGAISPNSSEYLVDKLEQPCKRNTPRDISVILSHLKAMYTAVHAKDDKSEFALILEDDVKFLYDIDFNSLVKLAPPEFGILQLITSNVEALNGLLHQFKTAAPNERYWKKTAWNHFTKNGKTSMYWSAQAYLINKKTVKSFLDDVITVDAATGHLHFKIINSFFPNQCKRTRDRPCVLSNCLFADSYIFSGGGPTYISTIPLFTGSRIGYTSTIHQEQVSFHQEAFGLIKSISHDLLKSSHAFPSSGNNSSISSSSLPPYVKQPVCISHR